MPNWDDTDEFIKKYGGVPPEAPKAQTREPIKKAEPPPSEGIEPPLKLDPNTWYYKLGAGAGRGLANIASEAMEYAPYASPLTTPFAPEIGEAARGTSTYQTLHDIASQPDKSWWETGGRLGAEIGATSYLPGLGAEGLVAGGLRGVASQLIPGALRRGLQRAAPTAGRIAGEAVRGAEGGALGDPEHPGTAAVGGAMSGLVPTPIGRAVSSRFGRDIGKILAIEGTWYSADQLAGGKLHFHPFWGPLIVWHHGPIGRYIRRSGNRIFDETGKLVGRIPAGAMGYFLGPETGKGMREAPETVEQLGRRIYGSESPQPGPR